MAAIFPILDVYSCIATKWTRHMGFCVTYTALLMKTWRYVCCVYKISFKLNKCSVDIVLVLMFYIICLVYAVIICFCDYHK